MKLSDLFKKKPTLHWCALLWVIMVTSSLSSECRGSMFLAPAFLVLWLFQAFLILVQPTNQSECLFFFSPGRCPLQEALGIHLGGKVPWLVGLLFRLPQAQRLQWDFCPIFVNLRNCLKSLLARVKAPRDLDPVSRGGALKSATWTCQLFAENPPHRFLNY